MSPFGGSHVLRDLARGVFAATGLPMALQSAPAHPAPVTSAEPPAPVRPLTADAAGYVETLVRLPLRARPRPPTTRWAPMTNKDPPAAEGRQHPEPVSVSDLPPLDEPIPAPAEGNDQAGPTRDELLHSLAA